MTENPTRTCNNITCAIDISDKKSNAQYCTRGCKDVEAGRRNYVQKEAWRVKWRKRNPDKVARYKKKTNASFGVAYQAKRRLSKRSPTSDLKSLKGMSLLARKLNNLTLSDLHLDHIEPLVNEEVCGLNTAYNLQLLTSSINMRKSNRRDYITPMDKLNGLQCRHLTIPTC